MKSSFYWLIACIFLLLILLLIGAITVSAALFLAVLLVFSSGMATLSERYRHR